LLSDHLKSDYRPLGGEESLLLIILDDLGRANFRFVRVKLDVTKRDSKALVGR